MPSHSPEHSHWTVADLAFASIDVARMRADENMFYLLTSASFVESGSDMYSHNLIDFFAGDAELADWLRTRWEPEELQHGAALRAYVRHVWPEFNWEHAHRQFLTEYATYCKVELLEPTRALELAARCVVETGTATYYRALARSTDEPVLRQLASNIANDEVSHYKNFYRFFKRYREREGTSRARIFRTIGKRTLEMKSEDADCAVRHAINERDPARAGDTRWRAGVSARMNRTVRTNLTPDMTVKMLMRPLELPAMLQSVLQYSVTQFMQRVFLR